MSDQSVGKNTSSHLRCPLERARETFFSRAGAGRREKRQNTNRQRTRFGMSDEREFLRANEIGRRGATSKRVIGKDSNEKIEGISFDDRQVSQQRRTAEGNGQRRKNGGEWKRWGETSEPFTDGRK